MHPVVDAQACQDAAYFEHAPCGLLVSDHHGGILRANAALCGWLGYSAAELVGVKRMQDLLSVGGRLFFQTHCGPLLAIQGSVAEVQLEVLTRQGSRLPVLINIVRRMADTQIDEWAFFAINERRAYERELLNERKRAEASVDARLEAEARLQEANEQLSLEHRRKDEFLATLAHELRNPLAPLRNVLEVIRLRQGDAPKELWGIDVIERQTRQLTHLVEDLMDVSRITQGRMQLRRKPCDLIAIVKAAVADLGSTIEAAGLRLALQLPGDLITVDADEVRLTQVISNLLTNAIKYTPAGGRIVLSVNAGDGEATLSICDTGIGIPAKALETVFTMFSQLTPALERSEGGLGIGLALVRGLVELHGGRISAASEGIGHGSTFTLVLPTLQAEAAPAPAPLASQLDQHLMILVVDDNADAADTLAMAIELLGHKVQVAYDARGALTLAAERRPDLILLDIGLPDMNGYEVAKRLRAEPWGQKLTLIAATGWGQDADRQRASDAGFDHHLVKPIEFNALIELLHHR